MTTPKIAKFCFAMVTLAMFCQSGAKAQPPAQGTDNDQPVRLTFHGKIDGSEILEITPTHAHWIHRHWSWPDQVVLDDIVWHPRKQPSLENSGKTKFLRRSVDFQSARLENVKGRDIVSLETGDDLVRVHICDSPNGADNYQFDIVFDRPTVQQSLRIRADIDGSDRLVIDNAGIWWEHRHWQWPKKVILGEVSWDPRETPTIDYSTVFCGPVDFSSAQISISQARDMVVLQRSDDRVVIDFADSPNGRADYDVTIDFGG